MRSWEPLKPDAKSAQSPPAPPPGRPARRQLRAGEREIERAVLPEWTVDIPRAVTLLPGVNAVMAAAFESKRGGLLVHHVMTCGQEPVSIAVAVNKGERLATLIRDSHAFALSMLDRPSKLVLKKFAPDEEGDPFDTFELRTLATGSPILTRASAALDCEVLRHIDLDTDHEMYVGQVIAAMVFDQAAGCLVPAGASNRHALGSVHHPDGPLPLTDPARRLTIERPGEHAVAHTDPNADSHRDRPGRERSIPA